MSHHWVVIWIIYFDEVLLFYFIQIVNVQNLIFYRNVINCLVSNQLGSQNIFSFLLELLEMLNKIIPRQFTPNYIQESYLHQTDNYQFMIKMDMLVGMIKYSVLIDSVAFSI